jgi:hypothetical protein
MMKDSKQLQRIKFLNILAMQFMRAKPFICRVFTLPPFWLQPGRREQKILLRKIFSKLVAYIID